jgi:hypothetical protein
MPGGTPWGHAQLRIFDRKFLAALKITVWRLKKTFLRRKNVTAPFKVNGQSNIILQQRSCGTRSKVSFVSNPAQIVTKYQISAINSC